MSNAYPTPKQHTSPALFLRIVLLLVMMASILPVPAPALAARSAPPWLPPTPLHLKVISARTEILGLNGAGVVKGDPILTYQYIINVDNSGDPFQPRIPDCYPRVA